MKDGEPDRNGSGELVSANVADPAGHSNAGGAKGSVGDSSDAAIVEAEPSFGPSSGPARNKKGAAAKRPMSDEDAQRQGLMSLFKKKPKA